MADVMEIGDDNKTQRMIHSKKTLGALGCRVAFLIVHIIPSVRIRA